MSGKEDAQRQLGRLYGDAARAYLKSKKVYRYNLKKIGDMDDREMVQTCHLWYEGRRLAGDYRAFEALYFQHHREDYEKVYPSDRERMNNDEQDGTDL